MHRKTTQLRKILHSWPAEGTAASGQAPPSSERQAASGSAGPSSASAAANGSAATGVGHGSGGGSPQQLQPQQLQLHFRFVLPLSGTPPTAEVDIDTANTWTQSPFYRLK